MDAAESETYQLSPTRDDLWESSSLDRIDVKIHQLDEAITQVSVSHPIQATPSAPTNPISPLISQPDKISGETTQYKGFLHQSSLYFATQEMVSDQPNITQLINLFMGNLLCWATVVWNQGGNSTSYKYFIKLLVFDHSLEGKEIVERLLAIKQGNRCTVEYTLEFRTLGVGSGWNKPALKAAFCQGLNT